MARKKWKRTPARLRAMRKNIKKAQIARHLASESRRELLDQAQQPRTEHLKVAGEASSISWEDRWAEEARRVARLSEELRLHRLFARVLERLI